MPIHLNFRLARVPLAIVNDLRIRKETQATLHIYAGKVVIGSGLMARLALQYVFAALLALLSTQAVVPSVRVAATIEIVCRSEAEQQIALETRCIPADIPLPQPALTYVSRIRLEPDAAVLFQRPPPQSSLIS
jgi:hypothetical protein